MIYKDMKKLNLCKLTNIGPSSLAKLDKRENVNIDILIQICMTLECGLGDIAEIVPNIDGKIGGAITDGV